MDFVAKRQFPELVVERARLFDPGAEGRASAMERKPRFAVPDRPIRMTPTKAAKEIGDVAFQ